jgi:hypothetical protein
MKRISQWGLRRRALLLLAALTAFFALAMPVAVYCFGRAGIWSAGLATLICLLSGWLALMVTARWAPPSRPAAHVLVGTSIRMSLPLLLCLIVTRQSDWLTEAGFAWFLVAAFCVGLAVETLLAVGQLQTLTFSR